MKNGEGHIGQCRIENADHSLLYSKADDHHGTHHDWKVVFYNEDGHRAVAGRMDALRAWSWFRFLHAWWVERICPLDEVTLELWRGSRIVLRLIIHLVPLCAYQHHFILWLRHTNIL